MAVKLKGDKEFENILSTKDKALRINLNENIYGTFSTYAELKQRCARKQLSMIHNEKCKKDA